MVAIRLLYNFIMLRYGPLGVAFTWIAGVFVSHLTGGQDINESNLKLLAPCIQNVLPHKHRHTELRVILEKPPAEFTENEKRQIDAGLIVKKTDGS